MSLFNNFLTYVGELFVALQRLDDPGMVVTETELLDPVKLWRMSICHTIGNTSITIGEGSYFYPSCRESNCFQPVREIIIRGFHEPGHVSVRTHDREHLAIAMIVIVIVIVTVSYTHLTLPTILLV